MIRGEMIPEFIGQIIGIFEDFLESKGIDIPNEEKEQSGEGAAIIYGTDYGRLQSDLEEMMCNWSVIEFPCFIDDLIAPPPRK